MISFLSSSMYYIYRCSLFSVCVCVRVHARMRECVHVCVSVCLHMHNGGTPPLVIMQNLADRSSSLINAHVYLFYFYRQRKKARPRQLHGSPSINMIIVTSFISSFHPFNGTEFFSCSSVHCTCIIIRSSISSNVLIFLSQRNCVIA